MDNKLFFFVAVLVQLKLTQSQSPKRTVSGEIFENVTFIHKTFQVPPSTRAIIEVDVSYPDSFAKTYPILGIYTTQDHLNLKRKCSMLRYGQLGNYNLHPGITMNQHESRPLKCETYNTTNTIHCTGNKTVQDFKPRKFSFSFGFNCSYLCGSCSLKGLVYKLRIYGQTNESHCVALSHMDTAICYDYGVFPNLFGIEYVGIPLRPRGCLELPVPFDCYVLIPKCDPVSKQMIHPCREMCHDFLSACNYMFGYKYNCDYLPARDGNIPCLYGPSSCTAPPKVKNASVEWINETAHYSCSEGLTLVGNKTITCKSLGLWSTPPQCLLIEGKTKPESATKLFVSILTPLLSVFLVIILILVILVIGRIRSKAKQTQGINREHLQADIELKEIDAPLRHLARKEVPKDSEACIKRNREFDAFVLYHFDTDDDFVMNDLLPELEETRDFKLCIHSRDFTPGRDIKDNIEEAIEGSNSAIIIMSQGFVDSM